MSLLKYLIDVLWISNELATALNNIPARVNRVMYGGAENDSGDRDLVAPCEELADHRNHDGPHSEASDERDTDQVDSRMDEEESPADEESSVSSNPDAEMNETFQNVEFLQWAMDHHSYHYYDTGEDSDDDFAEKSPDHRGI